MVDKIFRACVILILCNSCMVTIAQTQDPEKILLLERRIALLETALAPQTPHALITLFATAVATRNGAVQYMLLCPQLQKQYLPIYQSNNWISGVSSPTVLSFNITSHNTFNTSNHFTIK